METQMPPQRPHCLLSSPREVPGQEEPLHLVSPRCPHGWLEGQQLGQTQQCLLRTKYVAGVFHLLHILY